MDGEVNVAMLVYQSGEAAIQLFSGDSPEARKILGAALPALATQGDYKVGRHMIYFRAKTPRATKFQFNAR